VRDGRNLKTVPWGHQKLAIDFLRKVLHKPRPDPFNQRVPDGGGALLAMGMGTGKTLVAESMICNLDIETAIVAAPFRVVPVWPVQIARHAGRPDIRVVSLDGDIGTVADKCDLAQRQMQIAKCQGSRLVIVVNYESLWREPLNKWVLKQHWGLAVLDESHRVKQASGKASMFCNRLGRRATYRLCLSGTPMPHSPLDIYAQFRFLDPSILGNTYSAFKARYAVFGGFNGKQIVAYQNLDDLEARMARITFRVGKEVLDLPEDVHVTYECELSPGAQRVYDCLEKEFVAEVATGAVTAANAMVKLLRLAQVTSGFVKPDGQDQVYPVDQVNAKAALLEDTLEDLPADEPVVVFCRFHADLDVVHEIGKRMGRETLELSGRRDQLEEWQFGVPPILAVQIQSGGVGIDLTRARYSVYYSVGYSLGDYDQSLCRVHRPGQTRNVTQIHLAVKHTVDVRIMRALEKRAEVVASILDEISKEQSK
jgi:SNF2 family DNA or RNA helicase